MTTKKFRDPVQRQGTIRNVASVWLLIRSVDNSTICKIGKDFSNSIQQQLV
jgi:hypothetical protein